MLAPLVLSALLCALSVSARPYFLTRKAYNASQLQVSDLSLSSDVLSSDPYTGLVYARDGGYVGVIGNKTFQMNYDTLLCTPDLSDCPSFIGSNSFSYLTNSSSLVTNPPDAVDLCALNTATGESEQVWFTNTIALNSTHGVAWFQRHSSDSGEPAINNGVALIDVSNNTPVCTRVNNYLFDAQASPLYGFHGAIQGRGNDSYVYLFGSDLSTYAVRGGWSTVYLARVQARMAASLSAYQYWNGYRFVRGQQEAVPVMNDTVPGSVSYSEFHKTWLYLFPSDPFGSIQARTAPSLHGPWSNATTLFDGGLYYSPQVLPVDGPNGTIKLMYSTESLTSVYYQRAITITWQP